MINPRLRSKLEELISRYGYDQVIDSMPPKKVLLNNKNVNENRDDSATTRIVRDSDIPPKIN